MNIDDNRVESGEEGDQAWRKCFLHKLRFIILDCIVKKVGIWEKEMESAVVVTNIGMKWTVHLDSST